jgi:hypothetical protein
MGDARRLIVSEQPSNEDKKPWYRSNAFIIAVVTACLGFIFGIAQWAITRDPEPSSEPAGDVAAFCEAWRSNTNLNAVMADYVPAAGIVSGRSRSSTGSAGQQ